MLRKLSLFLIGLLAFPILTFADISMTFDETTQKGPATRLRCIGGGIICDRLANGELKIRVGDTSDFFLDDTNNLIGIGTTSPNHTLDIHDTFSGSQVDWLGIEVTSLANYTVSGARDVYGIETNVDTTGSANNTAVQYGGIFRNHHSGTGTVASLYGSSSIASVQVGAGNVTSIFGVGATAEILGDADATNAYGLYAYAPDGGTGSVITNLFGVYAITDMSNPGTVTNRYSVYADSSSGTGTNENYTFYGIGSAPSLFWHNIGVGEFLEDEEIIYEITFDEEADIGINRSATGSPAGKNTNLRAGGAFATSTNQNGGNVNLITGIATGNGSATIGLQAVAGSQGSGTTDRSPTTIATFSAPSTTTGRLTLGSGNGVAISDDDDGAFEFLGVGTGSDECLKLNLDDTSNHAVFENCASSSSLTDINLSGLDITLGGGNLNTGNIPLVVGDSTTDSVTITTDGTGDAEFVAPNNSISGTETVADTMNGTELADSITIDGASLRLGDGGSNYSQFSTAGLQTYAGTARPMKRIFLSATAGTCRTDNGCTDPTKAETSTNKINYYSASFAASGGDDFWQTSFTLPESYVDGGTFTASPEWSGTTEASATVRWGVQGVCLSDDDALDTAFGTAITVDDDVTVTGDFQRTAETSAITFGNSCVGGDRAFVQVYRDEDNDDATNAAKLLGVWLTFQVDALSTED